MGGIQYVYWPGTTTRLTPWMLYCLQRLDADLQRLFGVRLALDSSHTQRGIRTHQEQVDLFLSRYRLQASGVGPFGDVRKWQGRRYVRHSGAGTVAPPGESNHEIQRTRAAIDVADNGGAGIGTMGTARSNWLRANASKYGLVPEGFAFDEAWHYSIPNIFNAVPAGGANTIPAEHEPEPEEDDMKDKYCWYKRKDGVQVNAVYNTISGYFQPFESSDAEYNTEKARGHDVAGPSFEVTESDFQSIQRACAEVRAGKA